jgi:hypothetical protein
MVTLLKIKNDQTNENISNIFELFIDNFGFDASERLLVNDADNGESEEIYLFLEPYQVNGLINLFLENKVTIYSKADVTNQFIEMINSNQINDFKSNFGPEYNTDELIKEFTVNHITQDMILEKITNIGISALTETDYIILK